MYDSIKPKTASTNSVQLAPLTAFAAQYSRKPIPMQNAVNRSERLPCAPLRARLKTIISIAASNIISVKNSNAKLMFTPSFKTA